LGKTSSAVYAGAKLIRDRVQLNASGVDPAVITGTLENAVYMKQIGELSSELQQVFYVGVRRGKVEQAKGRDAYYWSWVEFGHNSVPHVGKAGASLGSRRKAAGSRYVVPHPFVRPGFESTKDSAQAAIIGYLQKRIPVEAAKLGPK
jgi:hypothetical protein